MWRNGAEVEAYKGKLRGAEVFDAELFAVSVATVMAKQQQRRAIVLTDSQAAARAALKGTATSSQALAIQAHEALKRGMPMLDWCPAHCGIPGNERADKLAKDATDKAFEAQGYLTLAHQKAELRRRHQAAILDWWRSARPKRYEALGLGPRPDALGTTRKRLGRIVMHRTGHGPFTSYLRRFGKEGAPLCACGTPRETQHLVYCKLLAPHHEEVLRQERRRHMSAKGLTRLMIGPKALKY